MPPLVSVVMPAWNAANYVAAAARSILTQTVTDLELIAVDDGSTDDTQAILTRISRLDRRLRVVSRANTGIVGALNDGLDAARGTFIARMDADDLAYPDRFARQLAFLGANRRCVAVGGAFLQIDEEGDPIGVVSWSTQSAAIEAELLRGKGGIPHPTAMIRGDAIRKVGGYRHEHEWVEDKDLWLRLAEIGKLANLPDVLLAYRLREQSVCGRREAEQTRRMERLLAEAYRRRRLAGAVPRLATRRDRGRVAGGVRRKWIRTAMRHGYRATAAKHTRRLLREAPLAVSTWITIAAALGAAARRGSRIPQLLPPNAPNVPAAARAA